MYTIDITVNGKTEVYKVDNLPINISHSPSVLVVITESRPTPYAPNVANAAPEEEALLILNECVAKLSRITRHAGNT